MTLRASELQVGDTYSEEVCRNLSRTQIVQYAGASGDYNPLHSDEFSPPRSLVIRQCLPMECYPWE